MMNATRVEVRRGKNESSASLIRRFSRRSQGLGLVKELRKRRYYERSKSKNVDHARAMIRGARRANFNELVKLGKIDPATYGKKPRRPRPTMTTTATPTTAPAPTAGAATAPASTAAA
jgi:ribosomal protein S21